MLTKILTDGHANSVHNTGIAFSLFGKGGVWLIVFTSILAVLSVAAWWFFARRDRFGACAFALFVAGAVGNLYDRIRYGYVRDFIHFSFWKSFPVFNVADIALTVGTAAVALYFIFKTTKKPAKATPEVPNAS